MFINILKRFFHFIFATSDDRVKLYIKTICFCKKYNLYPFGLMMSRRLQRKYGVFISYKAVFDDSLDLRHPTSIVIGDGVKLGRNVTIFQNVTLGRSGAKIIAYPQVGDNTIIYAGAVLLGDIVIGKNCIIGANAVVTKSVPDNCIAVGVPAKIIAREYTVY